MVKHSRSLRPHIQALKRAQRENDQWQMLNLYRGIRPEMNDFFAECKEARGKFLAANSDLSVDPCRIESLIATCEDSLLTLVREEQRDRLMSRAARSASECAKHLGEEMEPVAYGEMKLRKLVVLCLETGQYQWAKKARLSEWEAQISIAQKELRELTDEWRRFRKELGWRDLLPKQT